VLVDADSLNRRPVFDHDRLAAALSQLSDSTYTGVTLPFARFAFADGESAITFTTDSTRWRCDLDAYRCRRQERADSARGGPGREFGERPFGPDARVAPRVSPDSTMEAFILNYNVVVRTRDGHDTTALSAAGSEGDAYDPRSLAWSPDSRKLAAFRERPGYQRMVHYVESSPTDQLQPKHSERFYRKPGDVVDYRQPVLFDVVAKRATVVDPALFLNAYSLSRLEWREDSRHG